MKDYNELTSVIKLRKAGCNIVGKNIIIPSTLSHKDFLHNKVGYTEIQANDQRHMDNMVKLCKKINHES